MTFSGHDTFHCRLFWLKKGFDYISNGEKFKDDSGVELGVGKNMVNSIRFWLKAFGVITKANEIDSVYKKLLSDDGWDPYLENEATLYLLHYKLCTENHSSIYNLIFRELRKVKPEFSRHHFVNFVRDKDSSQNVKILEKDFSVFTRTYGIGKEKSKEDSYSGLMTELSLLREVGETPNKEKLYRLENPNQDNIPYEMVLYAMLTNTNYSDSISFNSFYSDNNGVGNIFCFDPDKLEEKLIDITENYNYVTYNSEAGIKELQFKKRLNPLEVLNKYYEK